MTYAELALAIQEMSPEQLNQTVTVYVREADEFYGLVEDYPLVESDDDCDVLDSGHKYLVI